MIFIRYAIIAILAIQLDFYDRVSESSNRMTDGWIVG